MLFLTEILGAEVIDVRQRRAGTVRDITVRVQEPYPFVTGLVTSRRRELVIPWSSVRSFAAATREVALRSSREEIEHNRADPRDVWLARDVLDKQVVDTDGRRVVRVNDLQLAESGGAMLLVGADIGFRGILRRLEAMLVVLDANTTFLLSGNGDLIEPDDGLVAIGSGGPFALAAAKALAHNTDLDARTIAEKAMAIAGEICIYTNTQISIEEL